MTESIEALVHRMVGARLNERRRIGREIIARVVIENQEPAYWHRTAEERLKEIGRLEKSARRLPQEGRRRQLPSCRMTRLLRRRAPQEGKR